MRAIRLLPGALIVLATAGVLVAGDRWTQQPQVKIPDAGVPQIMTLEGTYVCAAYNNEGYVILGYKLANLSIGEEWMLLEVGTTVRDGVTNSTLKRDDISITTPDGKTIPLATESEYRKADLRAPENRERVQRDSINYFPPSASQPCRLGFFAELSSLAMAYDQVELSNTHADAPAGCTSTCRVGSPTDSTG